MRLAYALTAAVLSTLILAAPAQAVFTSSISGPNVTMTSDAEGDLLIIVRDGAVLEHSRAGDPGFDSERDFNTGVAGTQTVTSAVGPVFTINGGSGSDFIVIGNSDRSAALFPQPFTVYGGPGLDALLLDAQVDTQARSLLFNRSNDAGTITFTGASGSYTHDEVEEAFAALGSGPDTVTAVATPPAGTVGFTGGGGNDSATVGGVLTGLGNIEGRFQAEGGSGTDDSVFVNDAPSGSGAAYLVTPLSTHRSGRGEVGVNNEVDRLTLSTSSGPDAIFKSGNKAVTINANGGDDLISARDSIGDAANCGAGNDFVLTDPLDTLTDCESSDRVTAPPSDGGGGDTGGGGGDTGGGTGTGTTTMDTTTMQSMMTMQIEMQDDTPPTAGVSGVGRTIKLRTLLRGLRGMVAASEPSSYEVQLLGSSTNLRLSRTYNVVLARQNLPVGAGMRSIRLRPSRRIIGRARRFAVRVVVTPTDAAGNRGRAVARTVRVRP